MTAFATPELLDFMGVEAPDPGVDVVVYTESELDIDPSLVVERRTKVFSDRLPHALLFGDILGTSADDVMVNSWFIVNETPFTQVERDQLTQAGIQQGEDLVTLSDDPPPWVAIRGIALAIGGLFGLAAVVAAVTLIRTEASAEGRVLAAVGAAPRTSRAIGGARWLA